MSKSPQFNIDWSAEQFKLTYAKVVSKVAVYMRLNDPKCTKSLWINLCDVVSYSPTLVTEIYTVVETLVQNNPLLHIIRGLQLPTLDSPHR